MDVPPPPPPPSPESGERGRSRSRLLWIGAAVVVVVGLVAVVVLALTDWGLESALTFLVGLAFVFGIPVIVGAVRSVGRPPGDRGARFVVGFFVAFGIEVVLVMIGIGICVSNYSSGGG